jgi:WD40 repeat protein/energy-coupling factor transporter ATP-binding protein EcfA2
MPRPERPLDPEAGAVQRFAGELRELRRLAGNPGYRELARRAHYSVTTLAQAARGDTLPSLTVTMAYVRACDGDTGVWETRWRAAADELGAAPGKANAEPSNGRAPYVGLAAFQSTDREWFFGRDRLVAELVSRMRQRRFVGVFGPSGCGKSSLLRAGLVPALTAAAEGETSPPVVMFTPGVKPLDECAIQLARLSGASVVSIRADLGGDPANLHLRIRQMMADRPAEQDLVLVIDQFEEVFTLCSDRDERSRFLDALITATAVAASRTRLVLGVRADFYGHCAHHPHLVDALRDGQVMVGPMTVDELRQAITGPAVRAGYRVETALVSRLIADATGQPAVLPLVSHALLETWNRRHGTTLTLAAYQTAGGIHHALTRTAETTYSGLDLDQQRLARQLFQRLTALGEGTEDTKRRIRGDELDRDDPNTAAVLNTLARARLITLDRDSIQLAHEALIRHWPRLRDWLAEDRDGLRIHRQLTDAAHTWHTLDRDPGALYRGTRLARADEWANTSPFPDLNTHERQFLDASRVAQTAEQAMAKRRSRRLRRLIALLAVLLLLTTSATIYAIRAQSISARQRNTAIIAEAVNRIAILNSTQDYSNRQLALALSLAAHSLDPNPHTRGSLIGSYAVLARPGIMAFSPDGDTLANVNMDTSIKLYDMIDPDLFQLAASVDGFSSTYTPASARFSPDGNTLVITGFGRGPQAAVDYGGQTVLFDIMSRRHVATLPGFMHIQSVALNGQALALLYEDTNGCSTPSFCGIIRLIDISNSARPAELATLVRDESPVTSAIFSPDGHTLATTSADGAIQLWDVATPQRPTEMATLNGHAGPITWLSSFSPDGRMLVTAGADKVIWLWDITNPRQPTRMATLADRVDSKPAVFSPDGRTLVTFDQKAIVFWDITDPHHPTEMTTLANRTGPLGRVVFSPDGQTLAVFGADHTIVLWDVAEPNQPAEIAVLASDAGMITSAAFSPDGQTLATTSGEYGSNHTRLWEIDVERIEAHVCQDSTVPAITPVEWDQYFPGLPFQTPCS